MVLPLTSVPCSLLLTHHLLHSSASLDLTSASISQRKPGFRSAPFLTCLHRTMFFSLYASTLLSGSGAQREMQTAMAFSSPGKATAKKQEGAGAQVGRGKRKCGQGSRLLRAGQGYGKGRGGPSSWESPPDNSSSWGLPPPLDNSAICCPCHTLCFESVQHTGPLLMPPKVWASVTELTRSLQTEEEAGLP